jgi:hypothetical protein
VIYLKRTDKNEYLKIPKETPKTTFRFPPAIKNKLVDLADLDSLTLTQTVTNLINAEYRNRKDEIAEFQKNVKNGDILRLSDLNSK